MRTFIGIPLAQLAPLGRLLQELRACDADLKVVDAQNLHVTLKFLGEIPDPQADLLVERLAQAGLPSGFTLRVRRIGAFPDWKKFNIVWAGLDDPGNNLSKAFVEVERIVAELGHAQETRPFSPHVTIARKRSDRGKDRAKELLARHREDEFGEFIAPGPRLYKSTLTPAGPVYENLGGAP